MSSRIYIFFIFKPLNVFVIAKSIRSNDMQALEASAFQPFHRVQVTINSIRRAEVIHIPNRLSTSGLIAATNSHLTPTKNRLEARHHDITRTQTVSVVTCCEQNGC